MVSARRPRTQPGHQRSSEIPGPGLAHDPYAAATHRLEFRGSHPTLQDRQVLMNAAAAAEVALAEFVYVKLGSVSERPGERVIRNANGIVGCSSSRRSSTDRSPPAVETASRRGSPGRGTTRLTGASHLRRAG